MYSSKVLLILNKIALELRRHDHLRFMLHDSEQVAMMLKQARTSTNPRIRWLLHLLEQQPGQADLKIFTSNQVTDRKAS